MADNKIRTDPRVRSKISAYNRQRVIVVIPSIIFTAILLLLLTMEGETFSVRLSILCSVLFLFCSSVLVLSNWSALLSFFAATIMITALLFFKSLSLFLIFILINMGIFLISRKTTRIFIHSATNEIELIDHLKAEATVDSLTQLLNRNGLEQALEMAWAFSKRDRKKVGVLLADIDYFKSYNDALGHWEGDHILKQVASSIKMCFKRETDIISRIGGEEFLIFLSDVDDDHVAEMAQFLSSAITNLKIRATSENNPCSFLSVSIGVVTSVPQTNDLLVDLYKRVDKALYHAKWNGRNCISFNGKIIKNPTVDSPENVLDDVHATGIF
jgi:diguanylate cyclase (GGDEF)-like protein